MLLAMLLMPLGAWAQTNYGLTIGGVPVTSDNAANIFGKDFATAVYDSSTNTLTLRGCQYSGSENFIVLSDGMESLNVYLAGYNQVGVQSDYVFSAADASTINITTDATVPGKLVYFGANVTDDNVTLAYGTSGLSLTEGDNERVIAAEALEGISYFGTGQLHDGSDPDESSGDENYPAWDYSEGAWYYSNAAVTNGDTYLPPTVSSSEGTSKMRRSGWDAIKSLTFQCVPVSGDAAITVALKSLEDNTTYATGTLTDGLVTLTPNASVTYDDVCLEFTSTSVFSFVPMAVKSTFAETYNINVANIAVTELNADDVLGDGKVSFNATTNTLTLSGANIDLTSGETVMEAPGIDYMGTANLTISLIGDNAIKTGAGCEAIRYNGQNIPGPNLVFTKGNAQPCSLQLDSEDQSVISTGFNQIDGVNNINSATGNALMLISEEAVMYEYQYNGLYTGETNTISVTSALISSQLPAPSIYGMLDGFTNKWNVEIGSQLAIGEIKYSLTYADESLAENNKTDETYTERFTLLGPATITATLADGDMGSPAATAYYFGVLPNSVRLSYEGTTPPTFAAAVSPSVDGVTLTPSSVSNNIGSVSEGVMTISGIGKGTVWANVSHPEIADYTVISDTIVFQMAVLPPAPTIVFDETKEYLNTDVVSITMPEVLAEDQNAVVYYSWVEDTADGNGTTYTDNSKVTLTAGTHTLYAWVRYNGATADDAVYSERVSQVFTVKSDIGNAYVPEFTTSVAYTGDAITPLFQVMESEKTQEEVDADNYTVSYQKIGTQVVHVDEIVDAGTYVITITGTGNSWGGSKTVTREFQVMQADNELAVRPTAIQGIVYTGKAHALVTAGEAAFGTVQYKVGANGTYSTDVPTATDAATYWVYFKVDGTDNYAAIEEDSIAVTIGSNPLGEAFASSQTWATYYNTGESGLPLPEGINAYVATAVNGTSVSLQAISTVPQGVAVLLEKNDEAPAAVSDSFDDNVLRGTSQSTAVSSITDGTVYVLYNGMFVKSTSGSIPAGKAYLLLTASAQQPDTGGASGEAPELLMFNIIGTTGIDVRPSTVETTQVEWYDMSGRRLSAKPNRKGLYMQKGKKAMVK